MEAGRSEEKERRDDRGGKEGRQERWDVGTTGREEEARGLTDR